MEIIERIDHWGRTIPDHPAYIGGGRTLTSGELRLQGAVDSLAAFVILNERPPRSDFQLACELNVQLIEHLPSYMIPRRFSFLETFPMNINGKADRRRLTEALT